MVWPHDLDTSLHLNNGRYWTLMDLGRTDIMIRSGLWRSVLRNGWVPVVGAGQIRFRRELRPFEAFRLETRIVAWFEAQLVMEHRLISKARDEPMARGSRYRQHWRPRSGRHGRTVRRHRGPARVMHGSAWPSRR